MPTTTLFSVVSISRDPILLISMVTVTLISLYRNIPMKSCSSNKLELPQSRAIYGEPIATKILKLGSGITLRMLTQMAISIS